MATFDRIVNCLEAAQVRFEVLEHAHVHTSEQAANIRGNRIEQAAKALILRDGGGKFHQFVVAGHRRLQLKKIKRLLGVKNIALAPPEDVLKLTGLTVGCIPPFGNLFHLKVHVDQSVMQNEVICFSAASHTQSIRMKAADYLKAVQGAVVDVSEG
jgi:Ala-tRNA(Pro) deacylase